MITKTDPRLQAAAIRNRYDDPDKFATLDRWHHFGAIEVQRQVLKFLNSLDANSCRFILNAGAGANDLGLCHAEAISLDLSHVRLKNMPRPVVGMIERLPFPDNSMDVIICVGSVINYCDAAVVIAEFARVLRSGGYLFLEFDSSESSEFLGQEVFRRSAGVVETFYAGEQEVLWLYSPLYITNLLQSARVARIRSVPIHILSPWILLLFHSIPLAAAIARFDRIARRVPFLTQFASNYLFFCQKDT